MNLHKNIHFFYLDRKGLMFFLWMYVFFIVVIQLMGVFFTFFNQDSIDTFVFLDGVLEVNGNEVGWNFLNSVFYAFFLTAGVFIAIKLSKHHSRLKYKLNEQNKKDIITFLKIVSFAFLCLSCFYLLDLLVNFFLSNYVGTHRIGNINLTVSTKRMEWNFFTDLALSFLVLSCFVFQVLVIKNRFYTFVAFTSLRTYKEEIIFDILGGKVIEQNDVNTISVSDLRKGDYILKLFSDKFIQIEKIVVK